MFNAKAVPITAGNHPKKTLSQKKLPKKRRSCLKRQANYPKECKCVHMIKNYEPDTVSHQKHGLYLGLAQNFTEKLKN